MVAYADFHRRSIEDRDAFWSEQAKLVDWETPPQQICDYSNPPFAKWFVGGKTNLCHNAVDRHLKDRADQAALIFVSTETNQEHTYSFRELHAEVQRIAALPDVRERLTTLGAEPSAMTPTEFGNWLKAEIPAMAKIVKDEKITVE